MTSIIRTRGQLIQYVKENLSPHYRSIHRALEEGTIKVLGGFSSVPPYFRSGWIVEVISLRKQSWFIAVLCSNTSPTYYVFILDVVPWENKLQRKDDPLYAGDNQEA